MSLSSEQILQLESHVQAGDRIAYYSQLADYGYEYGELALGVVNNDTLSGATANVYFVQELLEDGVSFDWCYSDSNRNSNAWRTGLKEYERRATIKAHVEGEARSASFESKKQKARHF